MRIRLTVAATVLLAAASMPALARCPDRPPLFPDGQVQFETASALPGPAEVQAIRQIAQAALTRRVGHVCVYGSASRREEGGFGSGLALDRAEAVAAELRAAGLPMFAIEVVPPAGRSDLLLGSLSGDSEQRVDIVFDP